MGENWKPYADIGDSYDESLLNIPNKDFHKYQENDATKFEPYFQEGGLKTQPSRILMRRKTKLDIESESTLSDSDSRPLMPSTLACQLDRKAGSMKDNAEIFILPSYPTLFTCCA